MISGNNQDEIVKHRYIDLMKKVLTDILHIDDEDYLPIEVEGNNLRSRAVRWLDRFLRPRGMYICATVHRNRSDREEGKDWPTRAETMIGHRRLDNLEYCFNSIMQDKVPGDFIETGVWRGGAMIFLKSLMSIEGVTDRDIWLADSFEGLPAPDAKYMADKDSRLHDFKELAVDEVQVMANFKKYNLLDDSIHILKGWFKDTLPGAPISSLAILRLDGDMYESTWDALENLYPKLEKGGYVIVDDYGAIEACKQAVDDYREQHQISEAMHRIDWSGMFWRKEN